VGRDQDEALGNPSKLNVGKAKRRVTLSAVNIKRAQLLFHGLNTSGVKDFVLSPGSRNTPLVLALEWLQELRGEENVRIHRILDERSAAFFALGVGRIGGVPAALVCTSGTAGAHYFPAVIEASQSNIPLLMLTADRPEELRAVGSLQTIDQNRLYGDYTRLYLDMGTPSLDGPSDAWVVATAARAYAAATSNLAGPVHLNLPFREPLWTPGEVAQEIELPATVQVTATRQVPSAAQLNALVESMKACAKGVIIAGPRDGAVTPNEDTLAQHVQSVAQRLGWPIIAEPGSGVRARLNGDDNLIAPADIILRGEKVAAAFAPELVLRFGKTPTSKVVRLWAAAHAQQTIVIDTNPHWHDPDAVVTQVVQADVVDVFEGLAGRLKGSGSDAPWLTRWQRASFVAEETIGKLCEESFWEGAVARQVAASLPEGALLHVANSMPIRDVDAMVRVFPPQAQVVHHRGANGIDGAISALLGEASAANAPSLLLCGDLTFLHDVSALHVAASYTCPMTIVVIDNRGGGIFEHLPISQHPKVFERNFITPHDQDLVAIARASGVRACRADDSSTLNDMLAEELTRPGLGVIVVSSERASNTALHRELWSQVQASLEMEKR
jgi:2-succinyl-5-enolpyruvyl-6-hydroxy-3-cyclohexene-1-carboxylate synthase